ncbi:MAG: tripartite tricarboxylate transporter TctB family protein [Ruegeria sp.]|uniref:tripartite tricarboxylate transporter TctB family protein n=1 Tax=Ruegeria sp. TaxID=1879320 RepID=UPI00349E830C
MIKAQTLQDLFKRYRRPGDLFYSCICLAFSLFLAVNLSSQTTWASGTKLLAQPAFWPYAAVITMVGCSTLHLISSFVSPKLDGRWQEIGFWFKSVEFAGWFMIYVIIVPQLGYFPTTIIFSVALSYRLGYRSVKFLGSAALFGAVVVIVFKSFLQVKVPGGAVYEYLPNGLRSFFLTYL